MGLAERNRTTQRNLRVDFKIPLIAAIVLMAASLIIEIALRFFDAIRPADSKTATLRRSTSLGRRVSARQPALSLEGRIDEDVAAAAIWRNAAAGFQPQSRRRGPALAVTALLC
jgi:hypothetical protein